MYEVGHKIVALREVAKYVRREAAVLTGTRQKRDEPLGQNWDYNLGESRHASKMKHPWPRERGGGGMLRETKTHQMRELREDNLCTSCI